MIFDHFKIFRFKEESESTRKALKFWWWRALLGVVLLWLLLLLWVPFTFAAIKGYWGELGGIYASYFKAIFSGNIFLPFSTYWKSLVEWITNEPRHTTWGSFFAWKLPIIPVGLFLWYELMIPVKNPYFLAPQTFGDGRVATKKDLKEFGLLTGKGLFLGMMNGSKMKLPDCRSVFCIGAPGTGKTTGCVIPAIFEAKDSCLIIHDPKGEIAEATSGYRATLGPVFKLNWGALDDPAKGIRWPSWNPLGGDNLPSIQGGREGYIDELIDFLIPNGPTGTDPYWTKAGRGCLTGLTGWLCGKVDQAKANDYFLYKIEQNALDEEDYVVLISYYETMRDFPEVQEALKNARARRITKENYLPIGKWGIIPKNWRGPDACFAMLLDVLNNTQMKYNEQLKQRRLEQDVTALNTDAWKMILEEVVLETAYYGYGRRTLLELTQVEALPDKQRGSVVSMALSGINIFKNAAVRLRTSMNDINYDQLRGIQDTSGTYRPITIYLSVPLSDLGSTMLVNSLFINMSMNALMKSGPNQDEMGPYPMTFILDEFHQMPSLKSITDGIVFGRSKQNSFFICVQDWHQISSKYDQETADTIMSSVAAKIIKRSNNTETRNKLNKGIETLTKVVRSYDKSYGKLDLSGSLLPGSHKGMGATFWNEHKLKIKTKDDTVIGGSTFLNMPNTKQIVLFSSKMHRPIVGQTPMYYNLSEYKEMAKIKSVAPMPEDFINEDDDLETIGTMQLD